MTRHNFSPETRHVIAARAGFRCSYPGCGQLTVGPAKLATDFENTGFACHIYAASEGGPRGQGKVGPDQLKHPTNGVWMCGKHENLIDKKTGARFPVNVLQSFKALHEFRTSYDHSGKQAPFGFARQLAIRCSPLFEPNTTIELAKTTFLIGPNGSGKTALCEWLSALGTSRYLDRWLGPRALQYDIVFDAPAEHRLEVKACPDGLVLTLDGHPVSRNYARSTIVLLGGKGDSRIRCDLQRIRDLLALEELALCSLVARASDEFVSNMWFEPRLDSEDDSPNGEANDDIFDLNCQLGDGKTYSFAQLSGGEQGRVLLVLAMELAREATEFGPVILAVEIKELGMDWGAAQPYLNRFANADCLYQTIVTSWELPADIEMLGWQIYRLMSSTVKAGTVKPFELS